VGKSDRVRQSSQAAFEFPLGIELVEGENFRQREGYEVTYLKDDEQPRYQFLIVVSVDEVPDLVRRLAVLLPSRVRLVLEIPGRMQGDRDVCEVYMSDEVPRGEFLKAFAAHDLLFSHDGMVGFGALSEETGEELFIDDHKMLFFYTPDMGDAEQVLDAAGLAGHRRLRHFSELSHIHNSLAGRSMGEDYVVVFEELRHAFGLQWQETKEYE
jgi:hypothetical protein